MPGPLEKLLNWLLLGLLPPVPNELRSDYVKADAAEQEKRRLRYAVGLLRWMRILAGLMAIMIVKWLWECGLLAAFGLGAGFATAGDTTKVQTEVQMARAENKSFRVEYRKDQLNAQLRQIATQKTQYEIAIAEAERSGQRPLALLTTRLAELRAEESEIGRQLAEMEPRPR